MRNYEFSENNTIEPIKLNNLGLFLVPIHQEGTKKAQPRQPKDGKSKKKGRNVKKNTKQDPKYKIVIPQDQFDVVGQQGVRLGSIMNFEGHVFLTDLHQISGAKNQSNGAQYVSKPPSFIIAESESFVRCWMFRAAAIFCSGFTIYLSYYLFSFGNITAIVKPNLTNQARKPTKRETQPDTTNTQNQPKKAEKLKI